VNKWIVITALVSFLIFEWYYVGLKPNETVLVEEEEASQNEPGLEKKELESQTIQNFHIVDTKGSKKELDLWASEAHKPMGSTQWNMENVKAQFYSEASTYVVVGKTGMMDEAQKTMVIEGDVKLNSSNGFIFYTDKLSYDPLKRQILSQDKVSLEGPPEKSTGRLYLEGIGLVVDMDTNMMTMQDQVKGFKTMSENRVMNISSQRGEFSGKKKSVAFRNNVVIKVDKMKVRGNYAAFQYRDGKLDTLYMDGGIHMQDENKTGSSGEAIVYFQEDKYVFRKKPFVTQDDNELIGDEVTIFNGGQRVQVKNAKIEYHEAEKKK
jgi:LPS export ABC transporter protein LptC/lipopolysaccharide transport protein LptA